MFGCVEMVRGRSAVEGVLLDWVFPEYEPDPRPPVEWLDDVHVVRELEQIQGDRARQTAREAELILRLAELRPDSDDPPAEATGTRSRTWRKTDAEFPGVSEFFPAELAHAINLGRGTAAFRARRAFTWQANLPATFAALREGRLDERRAGVLAEALQVADPRLSQAVEAALLDEAADLAPSRLRARALELLAELDADAVEDRRQEAQRAADVRVAPADDGMATLTAEMTAEEAAACYEVIDQLAAMAKADGDPRPIGQIRTSIHRMLILRPADHGLPGVTVNLTLTAALDGLEGTTARGGEVNGFPITAAHLRDLLRRIGALGLTAPSDGSLTYAITDERGQLLATVSAAELARRAAKGCPVHPDTEGTDAAGTGTDGTGATCDCAVLGTPTDTDAYEPRAAQRRFVTTRDRRCRFPNCGQRVGLADLDHVVPHSDGGATDCANLCCLCRSHHRLKTFAPGWSFRLEPDGTLHVTTPSGVTRTTRPPGLHGRSAPPVTAPPSMPRPPPDDDPPPF